VPAFTDAELTAFLQSEVKPATAATARDLATRMVKSYTRGKGFDPGTGEPAADLGAVILLAAARLYMNPDGVRAEAVGNYSYTSALAGFQGYTLAELAVLHRYRRRAA